MQIFPLSEGAFTIDATKVFIPFNKATDKLEDRPRGSLLVEVQPFAIRTEADIILLDTGLGFSNEQGLHIHQNLKAAGIAPEDITIVLLSHLHKDHGSGMRYMKDGEPQLSFPNATYYVNEAEYREALSNPSLSYVKEDIEWLGNHSAVRLTQDTGDIKNIIRYELSGGHSKNHQVFWIRQNGETVFFGADVAPQLQQMQNRFIAKYDFDGRKSMELRQAWWETAAKEHWHLLFYHDIKTPQIRL